MAIGWLLDGFWMVTIRWVLDGYFYGYWMVIRRLLGGSFFTAIGWLMVASRWLLDGYWKVIRRLLDGY